MIIYNKNGSMMVGNKVIHNTVFIDITGVPGSNGRSYYLDLEIIELTRLRDHLNMLLKEYESKSDGEPAL